MPLLDPAALSSLLSLVGLALVGAVASAINAVAGGGSLLTFPSLVGFGASPLLANATSSAALWPGSLASAVGYWPLLRERRRELAGFLAPTAVGAGVGAWLLVNTPERAFKIVVPGLVFGATLLLAFQPRIKAWIAARRRRLPLAAGYALQLAVSVYGGYFGAGMGILMLAIMSLVIEGTLHEMNAMKTCLGVLINLLASAMFVARGLVLVAPALALMVGAIAGGYVAARLSQRAPAEALRKLIVALGLLLTAWFTWKVL